MTTEKTLADTATTASQFVGDGREAAGASADTAANASAGTPAGVSADIAAGASDVRDMRPACGRALPGTTTKIESLD
ncbi:hypothetical protein GCM10017600_14270 [Streptosporangium carneum]|uniref:Uncharacterized protein n=1 Tax=Streptosporangium carneum TaxID=47481 RepID=A0A9W6MBG0_9ACTN|nr:hypothetical protein GCM10017600_14270 [Streptosporangium carneum]